MKKALAPVCLERRQHKRRRIRWLPGKLIISDTKEEICCFPIDVSTYGLGIYSKEWIPPGTALILKINKVSIPLVVVWKLRDKWISGEIQEDVLKIESIYRYGLKVTNEKYDLEKVFIKKYCLSQIVTSDLSSSKKNSKVVVS